MVFGLQMVTLSRSLVSIVLDALDTSCVLIMSSHQMDVMTICGTFRMVGHQMGFQGVFNM